MKVCSVNLCSSELGPARTTQDNSLSVELQRLCLQLSSPNKEFYRIFDQLQSSSITKLPQPSITLQPGGVVGDRHFRSDVVRNVDGKFFNLSSYRQVSILSRERYAELNELHNKNVQPGQFGENIQIEGCTSIESLSQGTILQFGNTAQIKIMHLRTYCYKFSIVLFSNPDDYFFWRKNRSYQPIHRIGVTGQVIKSGPVKSGDAMRIVHTPPEHVGLRYFDPLIDGVASLTPCDPPITT